MLRPVMSTFVALTFFASVAAAQQPCTTDANRVVSELYRHILQRAPDAGAQGSVQQLSSGRTTVRELVRTLAKSQEHEQRFGQGEAGESTRFERAVARYYRHILGRQPDPEGQRAHAEGAQRGGFDAVVDSLVNSQEYMNNFGDWEAPGSGGVTFCNNASSSNAPAPAPRAQVTEPRFRGMDRNRDGQITRAEWNGSNQSFRVHDWNGNGVLQGEEVRTGAFPQGRNLEFEDFDRSETFVNLDMNNNNRIEPREWHASLDAFNRLDRNRDGIVGQAEWEAGNPTTTTTNVRGRRANDFNFDVLDVNNNNRVERREWQARGDVFNQLDIDRNNVLSRAEIEVVADANPQRAGVGTAGDLVLVDSSVRWTDTGINVRAGQTLTFDADGEIRLSNGRTDFAHPSGSTSGRRSASSPVPSSPAGGLLARIGNGSPAYVGDRRALRAPASGRLYLSVNDDYLADNEGEYRVRIDVR
jgi:Ca2+-binding EF-hand superfamily protein